MARIYRGHAKRYLMPSALSGDRFRALSRTTGTEYPVGLSEAYTHSFFGQQKVVKNPLDAAVR